MGFRVRTRLSATPHLYMRAHMNPGSSPQGPYGHNAKLGAEDCRGRACSRAAPSVRVLGEGEGQGAALQGWWRRQVRVQQVAQTGEGAAGGADR